MVIFTFLADKKTRNYLDSMKILSNSTFLVSKETKKALSATMQWSNAKCAKSVRSARVCCQQLFR